MARKLTDYRCRECGFPRVISLLLRWNDNGTITQRFSLREFRVVFFHVGFLEGLFANVEERLGLSIEHLAFEAQRNASRAVFEVFYSRMPGGHLVRKFRAGKRMTVESFNKVAGMTGMCHSATLKYEPGEVGVARMKNPFNPHLMAANVVGAFEFLEDCPFDYSWEEEGRDSYVITVTPAPGKADVSERLEVELTPPVSGDVVFNRCPRCKVPRALSHLSWDEAEGIILDTRTGTRVMMSDGYMVTTVFRELSRELGEEVDRVLVDAQKDWTRRHVGEIGLTAGEGTLAGDELLAAYRSYLGGLPIYGQGNPVGLEQLDPGIAIEVRNPYDMYILAGTLQGLYEALEKKQGAVEWEQKGAGSVGYLIKPA